jgi:purine-binding chemotaxis protein CheW
MKPGDTAPDTPAARDEGWAAVHARIAARSAALEPSAAPAPEQAQQMLRARAQALAREPAADRAPEAMLEVVAFALGAERYGFESAFVREALPFKDWTPAPCAPPFIQGIMHVRGSLLAVLNLKALFGLPAQDAAAPRTVLVLRADGLECGVLADEVAGVQTFPAGRLQPPPATLTGIRARCLRGVADGQLVVLDAGRLLADEDLVIKESAP